MERPGFHHDGEAAIAEAGAQVRDERGDGGGLLAGVVGDAEAAAEIEVADGVTIGAEMRDRASSLSTASRMGASSRICEPMWQLTPSGERLRKWRARPYTAGASAMAMPNCAG